MANAVYIASGWLGCSRAAKVVRSYKPRTAALYEFGVTQAKKQYRLQDRALFWGVMWHKVRYELRQLRNQPSRALTRSPIK